MTPPHTARLDASRESVAASPDGASSVRWALAGLSLSMLMPALDTSIANAALPILAAAFKAPFQHIQWIVLAYLLAITTLIVGSGRLGDIIGRRRALMGGIVVFTWASVLCGAATTLPVMLAGRAAQGLGAAVLMALSVAFVADTVPDRRRGRAMGLLGAMSAIGTTLGPAFGGLLMARAGWRAIFLVNVPIGALAFAIVSRHLPADAPRPDRERPGFDAAGTLVLASTLAAYALAMTLGRGHFGPINAALSGLGICGALLFVFVERRTSSPVIRLEWFHQRRLRNSLVMNALVSTVMMATLVVGPFYLARALGLEAGLVGLVLSVGPLVAALSGVPAGRAVDRFGARGLTRAGLIGIASGTAALAALPSTLGVAGYLVPIVVTTASYAAFQAANNTAIMDGVRAADRGVVSAMLSLSRNLGLVTGASAMGAIFARAVGSIDLTTAQPAAVAAGMHVTFAVAAALMAFALTLTANGPIAWIRTHRAAPFPR